MIIFNCNTLINGSAEVGRQIFKYPTFTKRLAVVCNHSSSNQLMTEEIISRETLQEKLDAIELSIAEEEKKYYYLESIGNFIYHLHSFPSERTQARLANKINDYLLLLQEKRMEEHDLHEMAKQLLPDVWKISNEYQDELGFVRKPSYFFRLVLGVILFFLLKSSFGSWIAIGCVAVLAIATTVHSETKIKARKYW